jgi:hypothetical protein
MARRITDYNGTIVSVGGAYPYGDIKDNPSGTIIDRTSNADMQQFFQRLMAIGGVTPNGLPDNQTNGFQLFLALQEVIKDTHNGWGLQGIIFINSGGNLWANAPGYGQLHCRVDGDLVYFAGVIKNSSMSSPSPALPFTLPTLLRPSYKTQIMCYDSGVSDMVKVELNTDGSVEIIGGGSGGSTLHLEGTHYKLGLNTY